jgi:hypothetical protein
LLTFDDPDAPLTQVYFEENDIQALEEDFAMLLAEMRKGLMDPKHKKMLESVISGPRRCAAEWRKDEGRRRAITTYSHSKYTLYRQK